MRALWFCLLLGCVAPKADAPEPDGPCGDAACECPPPGPYGYEVGDTAADLSLTDCDGNPVALHDLCGARAGVMVAFYGWCTSCWSRVELVADLQAEHGADGMRSLTVVVEDSFYEPATPELCQQTRDYFDADVVVIDPAASIEAFGTTDLVVVMDAYGVITFARQDATDEAIITAVEQAL